MTTCRCDRGFVCGEHPDQPVDHDGCGAAGMQCSNPGCPWWQGEEPLALNPHVQFDHVLATSGLPAKARMLKAGAPLRWRRVGES